MPKNTGFALILLVIPIAFSFFCSLMPPTQSDGLRYHLSVPKLYLQHGGFYVIPNLSFSNFPFLMEYIYTVPLAYGLNSVPKMIHASFFWFCLRLIYELGTKLGSRRVGMYAVLLFGTLPFVSIFASWSFMEMGLTYYTLLCFALCLDLVDRKPDGRKDEWRSYMFAGLCGGFMLSCKYTALAPLVLLMGMLCFSSPQTTLHSVWKQAKGAYYFGLTAMVIASPWLIKNFLLFGNPVYPFAGRLFPTPGWTKFNALFFHFHAGLKGNWNVLLESPWWAWIYDAVTLPFRITFFPGDKPSHPEDFGSWPLGPVWLYTAPFLLFYRTWSRRTVLHLISGGFLYLVWAYTYRDSRFLLPALAVSSPLLALMIDGLIQLRAWAKWGFYIGVFYCLLFSIAVVLIPDSNAPWWVISGTVTKEQYLEDICKYTKKPNHAFHWLRENTKPDETVLLHGIEHTFYCSNTFVGADWFNTDPLIAWSWETENAEDLLRRLQAEKIRYLVYNYGKIKDPGHILFYRFFRLPQETGYTLLQEYQSKMYTMKTYPFAYAEWEKSFLQRFEEIEKRSPNIQSLETLLDGKLLEEVYRYVDPLHPEQGIAILKIPPKVN